MPKGMKIKDLKKALEGIDEETLVVLSRDEEGNGYGVLSVVNQNTYKDGEIGFAKLTPELEKQGYTEEDLLEGELAVVFYP